MCAHDNLGNLGDQKWTAKFFRRRKLNAINYSVDMHCRERRRLRLCERALLHWSRDLPATSDSSYHD
jgi:hypothetical protein